MEIFDAERLPLKTTGCNRTGCMFCMFGCVSKDWDNLERIKTTHPNIYEYLMRPKTAGGLGLKEIIDWLEEHGNLHIRH